jgi:hypothetical protein
MKYQVIMEFCGRVSILTHRDRTSWCKRTATKHMNDVKTNGHFVGYDIYLVECD